MAELSTIARPYAKAIFETALLNQTLKDWSKELAMLAGIVEDQNMQTVLNNPLISKKDLSAVFMDIVTCIDGGRAHQVTNLIQILIEKKRLNLLPAIASRYEKYLAEREKRAEVKVISAYPIDEIRLQRLTHALQNHLKRQIVLECAVDKNLLGGIIIYAGDRVIDGSLRTKLKKLSESLCS